MIDRHLAMCGQMPSYRAMFDREGATTQRDVAIVDSRNEVSDKHSEMALAGAEDFAVSEFTRTPQEREEAPRKIPTARGRLTPSPGTTSIHHPLT